MEIQESKGWLMDQGLGVKGKGIPEMAAANRRTTIYAGH